MFLDGDGEISRSQLRYLEKADMSVMVILCITAQAQGFVSILAEADGARQYILVHILHRGPDLYIFVTRGYFVARKASTTALFLHFLPSTRFFLYIQRELANTRLVKLY